MSSFTPSSSSLNRNITYNSQLGPPAEGYAVDEHRKLRFGMIFYIFNDVILAVFFIGSYIFLRGYNSNGLFYLPSGTAGPSLLATTVITGLAILAAVVYFVGYWLAKCESQLPFRLLMLLAFLLALIDLAAQVWFMGRLPFTVTDGGFASAFIVLSGYHVYHMAGAVFVGSGVTNRAFHGRYSPSNLTGVYVIGFYFAWTAVYALAIWALVLIQPPFPIGSR